MQSTSSPLGNGNSYSRLATLSPHGYPQVPFRNHSPAIQDRIHASPMPRDSSAVNLNVPLSTSRVSQGNPEERKEMWNNHKLFRSFATESNNDHE